MMYQAIILTDVLFSLFLLLLSFDESRFWLSRIRLFRVKQKGLENARISKTKQIRQFQVKLQKFRKKYALYGGIVVAVLNIFYYIQYSGLEAEISPLFGLTLLELVEWVAFATIASGTAAVISLIFSSYNIWRTETQIKRQKKVDSARFTIDFIEKSIFKSNQQTIRILDERQSNKDKKFKDSKDVEGLLNVLDTTVQFINDDVINKSQALTSLRITLRRLKNDTEVDRIIKKKRETEATAFDKVTVLFNQKRIKL